MSEARKFLGGDIAFESDFASDSSTGVSKCTAEANVNCDSLITSSRLLDNNISPHIEVCSVNAPAIAVSAAAPNGDGLDRNGNSQSSRSAPNVDTRCFNMFHRDEL